MRASERDELVASALRELAALDPRLGQAHNNCRDWNANGYPHNSLPQIGGRGGHNDPAGSSAVNGEHDYGRETKDADQALLAISHNVAVLVAFVNRNAPPTSGIYCGNLNCDRVMSGKDNDRPRGPERECVRCYWHRKRHGQPWPRQRVTSTADLTDDEIDAIVATAT